MTPTTNQILQPREKEPRPNKHISFSEIKKWDSCPYARKLAYGQRIRLFNGNAYTAFGTALHETIEAIYGPSRDKPEDSKQLFVENLQKQLEALDSEAHDKKLSGPMPTQGTRIIDTIETDVVKDYFGDFEVISLEEELYTPITELNAADHIYNFKGFIDMVIKTTDGTYHIIDWKSCSWGWDARRKSDPMNVYQLTYYKQFFA